MTLYTLFMYICHYDLYGYLCLIIYNYMFQSDVLALVEAFEQLGNPFKEESGELLDLDQSIVMPTDVVENVRKVKDIGLKKYQAFVDKRICSQEETFTTPIPHTKLKLFKASLAQPHRNQRLL